MSLLILGGDAAGDALAEALTAQGGTVVRRTVDRRADLTPEALLANSGAMAPTAVVILVGAAGSGQGPRPLASLSDADWTAAFDRPLREARVHLQAAERLLTTGGRVIMVASTGGMAGTAGDVAGCAVEEGARALAKSVALAWQPRGITLAFTAFAAGALESSDGVRTIVAPTLRMLLGAVPAFSGSTVIADGGVLLAP